jgi:hypothetical protein
MEVRAMKAGRVTVLIGVGIILVMVLTVSMWVIPRVPEGAVSSFWAFTIANILFGLAMLGAAFFGKGDGGTALLVCAGIGAVLFGLWMLDGANSSADGGPIMQAVTIVMYACVAGDGLAVILAFVGAGLLARTRKRGFSAV